MKTFLVILLVSSAVANTTATSNRIPVTDCKLFDANNATIDVQNGLSIQGLNVAMKAGTEFATLTTENVELFSISDSTYITVNLDKDSQILTFSTTLEFENYQRFETNKEIEIFIQNFKCSDGDAVTGFASPMFVFPLKFSNIYPPEFLVDDMVVESVTFNISMPFPKISLTKNYHSIYAIDMDLQNNNISFELDEIGKKYLEMTPTQLKNGLRTNYSIDLTPITVLNIETELAIHLNAWDSGNPSMNSSLEILFTPDVKATTPISPWFKEAFYLADMSDLTPQTITVTNLTLMNSNDSFTAELNTNLPVPSVEINLVGTPSEELLQLPFITFELMAVRDGALKPGRTAIFIKLPGSLCVEPTTTTESPTTVTTECDCPTEETTTIEPCPTTFIPELTTPCPDCICTTETTESSIAGQTTTTSGETTPEGNSTPVSTATTTSGQTSPSSELTTQCPTLPECDCSADTTESSVAGQTTSGETTSEGNSTPEIISSSVPDQKTSSSGLTTEYPPIPECSSTTETSLMPDKTSSSTGETTIVHHAHHHQTTVLPRAVIPLKTALPAQHNHQTTVLPRAVILLKTALPTQHNHQNLLQIHHQQDRQMNRAIVHHAHHHQTTVLPRAVIPLKTALPVQHSLQTTVLPRAVIPLKTALPVQHSHQTTVLPRAVIPLKTALPAQHNHQTTVLPRAVIPHKTALPVQHSHQTTVLPRAVIPLKTALPAQHFHQNLVQTHHLQDRQSALVAFLRTCTGHATHPLFFLDHPTVHVL
uniref:Uncharacterized protein n=1 Tax=Timema monikensis TaxID=170555 RepID=A0A7R9HNR2_9NEOP|nr:unnamed protein product [Timema monikensis]